MCTHRISVPQKSEHLASRSLNLTRQAVCLTDKVARVLSMCRSDDKASVGLELEMVEVPRGFSRMVL